MSSLSGNECKWIIEVAWQYFLEFLNRAGVYMRFGVFALFLWLLLAVVHANDEQIQPLCVPTKTASSLREASSFRINQARSHERNINVYLTIRDRCEQTLAAVEKASLQAMIGTERAKVLEVHPIDKSAGVAYIFLVDKSKSVKVNKLDQAIQTAIENWQSEKDDKVALITFGSEVKTVIDFSSFDEFHDKLKFKNFNDAIQPTDQKTRLHDGLIYAVELGRKNKGKENFPEGKFPDRRAIIVLSDGIDDFVGGATREEVFRTLEVEPVPIYAIGLEAEHVSSQSLGIKALGEFARKSGGGYFPLDKKPTAEIIKEKYNELHSEINEGFKARLSCDKCPTDGRPQHLEISFDKTGKDISNADNTSGDILSSGIEIRLIAPPLPLPQHEEDPYKKFLDFLLSSWPTINVYNIFSISVPVYVTLSLTLSISVYFMVRVAKKMQSSQAIIDSPQSPAPVLTSLPPIEPLPHYWLRLTTRLSSRQSSTYDLRFTREAVLGSGMDCDMVISDDTEIAQHHCAFAYDGRHVAVADLGTTAGTFVNGVKITQPHRLEDGDVLTLGRTQLRVSLRGVQA